MTYIENIFLCLALPMLLSLLFTSGSPRRFTLFVVLGMATCLLSAYVSSFFMGRHQCSAVTTAIEIAPVCEEILKLLPLLLYFLIFEPDSHKLTPAAIGIAVTVMRRWRTNRSSDMAQIFRPSTQTGSSPSTAAPPRPVLSMLL